MILKIPKKMTAEKLEKLTRLWEKNEDVSIHMTSKFDKHSARVLSNFLLEHFEEELSVVILHYLVEMEVCQIDIVEKIFDKGDVACKVAVALSDKLNKKIIKKCLNSEMSIVREHFLQRRTKRGTLRKRQPAEWMYRQEN